MELDKQLTVPAPPERVWALLLRVDLLGRLGTFGLAVMKTKADRLCDEFGLRLIARAAAGDEVADLAADLAADGAADGPAPAGAVQPAPPQAVEAAGAVPAPPAAGVVVRPGLPAAVQARPRWWQRLIGRADPQTCIQVIIERNNSRVEVRWPLQDAQGCEHWLRELLREGGSTPAAAEAGASHH